MSREAGTAYRDRLLALPAFLSAGAAPSLPDVLDGFRLTGYFLNRHVFEPRGLAMPGAAATWIIRYLAERPH